MHTATKVLFGAGALVGVWTLAQAEARQPGTTEAGINSASDAATAGVSGGIRVVINGTQEATAILPQPAPAAVVTEGGESTTAP